MRNICWGQSDHARNPKSFQVSCSFDVLDSKPTTRAVGVISFVGILLQALFDLLVYVIDHENDGHLQRCIS